MHVLACMNQLVHLLVYADYAYGERKFGGNAQAITKQRWLHHTSLLWDFSDARMRLLKHPSKAPEYRAVRLLSSAPKDFGTTTCCRERWAICWKLCGQHLC